ncbi:hypothetical protein O9K51_11418 [Purpureocillium lavendulum]|uniref:Uncharacterized protein n=1 Tax=Purpureocillium lavendulum TaxID=1247861 RepID=A0AB34FB57_9HYPO|nr:hypothetical protein O9K51_11418 [Purpureocillium lavendulum]
MTNYVLLHRYATSANWPPQGTKEDVCHLYDAIKGSSRVESFRDQVSRDYKLPGRISLHRANGDEVCDDFAFIGDIVTLEKTVRIRYDEEQIVANGGWAGGATVSSTGGRMAFAGGAYAGGGSIGANGAVGGEAIGGKGFGDTGHGGGASGGSANYPSGAAEQGEAIGGKIFKHK